MPTDLIENVSIYSRLVKKYFYQTRKFKIREEYSMDMYSSTI